MNADQLKEAAKTCEELQEVVPGEWRVTSDGHYIVEVHDTMTVRVRPLRGHYYPGVVVDVKNNNVMKDIDLSLDRQDTAVEAAQAAVDYIEGLYRAVTEGGGGL